MSSIQITDTLHERLLRVAEQRGEGVDEFVTEVLKMVLQIVDGVKPMNLQQALADARFELEKNGVSLLGSWQELDAEIAERRGGYDNR